MGRCSNLNPGNYPSIGAAYFQSLYQSSFHISCQNNHVEKKHNAVNLYTSKDSIRYGDRKLRFVDFVQENLGSRNLAKNDWSIPLYCCFYLRINICDTKIFTTVAAVSANGVPDQVKCTCVMEFEFTMNQILLTKLTIDFTNPLISTYTNNKET